MKSKSCLKIFIFLIPLIIFLIWPLKIIANDNKIFYSGFSFSNLYESNSALTGYSSELIKEINKKNGLDIISSTLLDTINNSNFSNIDLDTKNLLDFDQYPNNAIVMSVALQHEEFTQEYNYSSKTYNGFFDSYFQILFFDFSSKNLIASLPFDFEILMLSEEKFTKKEILKKIKDFYLKDNPFNDLEKIINNFDLNKKYDLRIGIKNVEIEDRAYKDMPPNSKKYSIAMKNLIAQTFSKRLSTHHNIAIVPYMESQSIGNVMKLRFVQTDEIYSIQLPDPDYHIHINLKGFKKVLAKTSDVEELFLYGSFLDLKIFQPDLNKIYFDNGLRGVTKIKIPKGQSEINDWRKYYYNMEILFDNFSKNIIKQDKKWLKETTKDNIKKDLKNLEQVIDKVK